MFSFFRVKEYEYVYIAFNGNVYKGIMKASSEMAVKKSLKSQCDCKVVLSITKISN